MEELGFNQPTFQLVDDLLHQPSPTVAAGGGVVAAGGGVVAEICSFLSLKIKMFVTAGISGVQLISATGGYITLLY